ncbi:hypothetical protein ACFPOB_17960 [Bosea eneae]|uniref:Host nuclease inhibitor protein n=1 Tax=Bosea eneae TaxID=151454 RepID=A0ABW0IUT9_9HYPH
MAPFRAYCWRGGVIEFGRRIPEGALPVDQGSERSVRRRVEPLARHAYDGKTLLVPGIPEAEDDDAALAAYERFKRILDRKRANVRLPRTRRISIFAEAG